MKPTEIVLASHEIVYHKRQLKKQIIDVVSHGTIPSQYLRTINSDYFFHLISNLEEKSNTMFSEAIQNNFILNTQEV